MSNPQEMQNAQPPVQQEQYQQPQYQQYPQEQYQQVQYQQPYAPVGQLKTNRGLGRYILFTFLTLGIYSIVFYSSVSSDINLIASRYDGRKTMHFCLLLFLIGPLTLGIGYLVWLHRISDRIGSELVRRGMPNDFNAGTFWLWGFLGSLIIVGPFIYVHKLCKAMNDLSSSYNIYG